jgi:hypothetical protein
MDDRHQESSPRRIAKTGSCTHQVVRYKYSMGTPQNMNEILDATLRALEALAHQKLVDGDFEEVTRVASAASLIRCQMLLDPRSLLVPANAETQQIRDSDASPLSVSARRKNGSANKRPRGYPRFYKEDDRLVKVGWSKKNRSAYEHRAGKEAVYAVLDAIRYRLTNRRTFKVDELFAAASSLDLVEVPQYVQYLVVAWLESCRILNKQGRDGYSKNGSALAKRTNAELWEETAVGSATSVAP